MFKLKKLKNKVKNILKNEKGEAGVISWLGIMLFVVIALIFIIVALWPQISTGSNTINSFLGNMWSTITGLS